jgi:hypothetical protein
MPVFAMVAIVNFVVVEADPFQQLGGHIRLARFGCSARFSEQVEAAISSGADNIE